MAETNIQTTQLEVNTGLYRRKRRRRELSGQVCTACDQCYRCKVKCSGEKPNCERCRANKSACTYSTGKPLGKPKGSKNKVQRSKSVPGLVSKPSNLPALDIPSHPLVPVQRHSEDSLSHSKVPLLSLSPPTTASQSSTPVSEKPVSSLFSTSTVASDLSPESKPILSSNVRYSFDTNHTQQPIKNTGSPQNVCENGLFLYTDSSLQTGSFNWLPSNDTYLMASPDEMAVTDWMSPQSSIDTSAHPSISMSSNDNVELSMIGYTPSIQSTTPCLCDPVSLGIISELQSIQQAESQLDTALLLARRGFGIVSACLACAACHSSSGSLFFACILIIQQIFTCYGALRVQGLKMLNSSSMGVNVKGQQPCMGVGEFNVEDGEGCFGILNTVVKLEMERSKRVLGGLEMWAERSQLGEQKMAKLLLRTLKEELAC